MITLIKNKILFSLLLVSFAIITACGGGGSSSPSNPGTKSKSTFTGIIKQSTGNPLPGAVITLEGTTKTTITNANGVFIIPDTLQGDYTVDIDGSSANGDAGTSYGILKISASVGPDNISNLEQVIIMPDLSSASTAIDTVVASAGVVSGGVSAINGEVNLGSNGADVTVQLDGVNAQGSINVSATPVPLSDLPMTLPESAGANAADFVTIQPANATFDPPLDLTIPNDQGFAPGTEVDIYSFDHDVNDWVNRSAESTPSNKGVVSADGSVIEASGIITKGGWHGPLLPADFIETVIGVVKDGDTPLEGIMIFTSTGQFAVTAADGTFAVDVPVVTGANDIFLTVTAPGLNEGVSVVTAPMTPVDDAISLDFGMIDLTLPTTGTLTGFSLDTGAPSTQSVTLTGPVTETFVPNADGSFSIPGLPAGDYSASTTFSGDSAATTVSFSIVAGQLTILTIQKSLGNDIAVKVFLTAGGAIDKPIPANDSNNKATVTLTQGSTALTQTTDANGLATFSNITGTVTVTAQIDYVDFTGTTVRSAYTVHDISPVNGQVGIVLTRVDLDTITAVQGTSIQGRITNIPTIPAGFDLVVVAQELLDGCCDKVTSVIDQASIINGEVDYSINTPDNFGLGTGDYVVMAIIAQDHFNGNISYDSAAVFPGKVTTAEAQITPNIDLSFSDITMKYEFVTKNITVNNSVPLTDSSYARISSDVVLAGGEEFSFDAFRSDFQQTEPYPASASLVSVSPGGVLLNYSLISELIDFTSGIGISEERNASLVLNAATAITFDLLNSPVITSPGLNQTLTVDAARNMTVNWVSVGGTDAVLVNFFAPATGAIPGVDFILWQHALQGQAGSMSIPDLSANSLQMFAADMEFGVQLDFSVMAVAFNFNEVFDFNVNSNIRDILYNGDMQESISTTGFIISP